MHFQIPVVLAFGASLASTMALPNVDNSTIEKRSKHGWVGSFTSPSCAGSPDPKGSRPEFPDTDFGTNCQAFQYVVGDPAIGVNFGSGYYEWPAVTFFSDANCVAVSSLNKYTSVTPGPDGMACVAPASGTVVNSFLPINPS